MIKRQGSRRQFQDQFLELYPEFSNTDTHQMKNITLVVTEDCQLRCTYCVTGDTEILMSDFNKKPIKDIEIGDQVLAFEENIRENKHRKQEIATVTELFNRTDEVLNITLENGMSLNVTAEHPLLITSSRWRPAGECKIGQSVKVFPQLEYKTYNTKDINYITGYFIAMMIGDGSYKKYKCKNGYDMFKIRLAVLDKEIITRMSEYSKKLNIDLYEAPFRINKGQATINALFGNTRSIYNIIHQIIQDNMSCNETDEYKAGFLSGIYDAEGHISREGTIRICNTDLAIIEEIERCLQDLTFEYIVESAGKTINHPVKYNVRILSPRCSLDNLRFIKTVSPACSRKGIGRFIGRALAYTSKIISIEPIGIKEVFNIETTSHTYYANNFAVHNCYECNKNYKAVMNWETAKKAIDMILDDEKLNGYMNSTKTHGVILEFIGGEPLLQAELILKVTRYFKRQAFLMNHNWGKYYMFSISTNGVAYLDKDVRTLIKENVGRISITITIDGDKQLHDTCRVFPDGSGSHDIVMKAIEQGMEDGTVSTSKVTIAPENMEYIPGAIEFIYGLGIKDIHANTVYEDVWKDEDAQRFYKVLIDLADYMIEDRKYQTCTLSLLDEVCGNPQSDQDTQNWCFAAGTQILTPNGYMPIEYMMPGHEVVDGSGKTQPVINISSRSSKSIIEIRTMRTNPIYTTSEHPFATGYIEDAWIWTEAQYLRPGDILYLYEESNTTPIEITSVRNTTGTFQVYNMTIDDSHTFVANGVIVHNCGGNGNMLAIGTDGRAFPCIRFMRYSLATPDLPEFEIGDVDRGMDNMDENKFLVELDEITRQSQSTQECLDCQCSQLCAWCFKAGTMILTPNGNKPIQHLSVLDEVIDSNGDIQSVEHVYRHIAKDTIALKASGTPTIYTTVEHPFWARHKTNINIANQYSDPEWIAAGNLRTEDKIALYSSETQSHVLWSDIESIDKDIEEYEVFNLQISNTHTFIADGAIVHNCTGYNYDTFGTPNKRAIFICKLHKARSIVSYYYWNKLYALEGEDKYKELYVKPEDIEYITQGDDRWQNHGNQRR